MILFQSSQTEDRPNDMLNNNVCDFVSGVYLHGDIQDQIGYDCVVSPNDFENLKEGRYTVTVFDGKEEITCTLYYWTSELIHGQRGLIVQRGDFKNADYAQKQYELLSDNL